MTIDMNTSTHSSTRLTGFRLWAVRLLWLALVLPLIGMELAVAGPFLESLQTICPSTVLECSNQLSAENAASLAAEGISLTGYAISMGSIVLLSLILWQGVGVVLFLLRSDDWMAILVSLFLIVFGGATFSSDLLAYAERLYPQLGTAVIGLTLLGEFLITAFFLLFPNGRFVPRWLAWLLVVRPAVSLRDYLPGIAVNVLVSGVLFFGLLSLMLFAQIYRYRFVSTPFEKRQTRWVMFGTIFGISTILIFTFGSIQLGFWTDDMTRLTLLSLGAITLGMAAIPVSIGIAMLRSKLWDIDVVVRKTTVYAILTGILLLAYFSSIVILQRLLSPITGDSDAAVVLSTLLIAALFLPLRRRVQSVIDRRFFRSKYDAEKVLEQFAATVRDETDLDELTAELVRVIQDTMQPEFVSVWLKEPGE